MSGTTKAARIRKRSGALRLLLATPRYPPFTGGIELHVHEVARRLALRGVHVDVITTDPSGQLPKHEVAEGVAVHRVRAWPRHRDYYFAPSIYREITNGRWDVVHVHSYLTFAGPLAMLAARRSKQPYVVTFHAGGLATLATWKSVVPYVLGGRAGSPAARLRYLIRPLQLALVRPLLTAADGFVALAPFEVDFYARKLGLPRSRFVVIPNGSDLPRPSIDGDGARDGALIASIGRLEHAKGHHRVLAAFQHIAERRPDARLWIAGCGPYESELRRITAALGLSDKVTIEAVPLEDREQMADRVAQASVVVLLSEFETQPIAALEAASLGCRLVVADVPGLHDLARRGIARPVAPTSSSETIAAAVLDELELPSETSPLTLPTWDDCADALLELYASVIHASSAGRSGMITL